MIKIIILINKTNLIHKRILKINSLLIIKIKILRIKKIKKKASLIKMMNRIVKINNNK